MSAEDVAELRSLIRAGSAKDGYRVRELLARLTDPLDVEAAGALLRAERGRSQLAESGGFVETRIAVLGSSTMDALPNIVTAVAVRDGLLPEIRLAGYNQWRLELMAGAPHLSGLRPRVVACLLDESAVLAGVAEGADVDLLVARCEQFPAELAGWVATCREVLGGLVALATIPLSPLRRRRLVSFAARSRLDAAWHRMNAEICDLATGTATVVLAGCDLAATAGATFASDRMRHAAAHVFAPEYLLAYAQQLVRVAAADLGRARKCLVLDLDGTLWGGTVGEDGVAGLQVGGAYPGSAHAELQAFARDVSRQGVLLAISSKNDEQVAADALANHPEQLLRPESFVANRINWQPKADNLQDIADELNLGLDSMVFVDDHPGERDQMRELAPAVATVQLPPEPAGYTSRLTAGDHFAVLSVTDEDRERVARYRAEAGRRELVSRSGSLTEYLESLGSTLTVEPLLPTNADRIGQLFAKTNQFNLTGIRYGAAELAATPGGTSFYAARLADRVGESGLVAAVAINRRPGGVWLIENLVLSCRVFGRSVEDALVGIILRAAARAGATAVAAGFQPTARNQRFADFYPRLGFQPDGPGSYRHDLRNLGELPRWIEITNDQEVFSVR